jgi:arylsulfatase A
MKRRNFLLATAASVTASAAQLSGQKKPNFVFLLADDLGYGDLNLQARGTVAFGNPNIKTPNLARLARESLLFTHHYSASPVCSPSRAGLLTGRTPTRCNIDLWINDLKDDDRMFLSGKEVTIPEVLRQAGYTSAVFGKWHLNGANWEDRASWTGWTGSFPLQQGFDTALVTKENPHLTRELTLNSQENPGDYFHGDGRPAGTLKGFSSAIIVDQALEWLRSGRNKSKPFFLYLPFDAVHEIISSPPEFQRMYDTSDPNKDAYYANVSFLDAQVGRFVRELDAMGLGQNTVVFFSSDNGPDTLRTNNLTDRSYGTSYPLRGQKRQLFEGGIRVPGLVRWPERIKPAISDYPNCTLDVLPTLCDLAGVAPPGTRPLDGISIAGHLLQGSRPERAKPLYWHFQKAAITWETVGDVYNRRYDGTRRAKDPVPHVAIRRGRYKLHGYCEGPMYGMPQRYELYDVVSDQQELLNIADKEPHLLRSMVAELERMHRDVLADRQRTEDEIRTRQDQRTSVPAHSSRNVPPAPAAIC